MVVPTAVAAAAPWGMVGECTWAAAACGPEELLAGEDSGALKLPELLLPALLGKGLQR